MPYNNAYNQGIAAKLQTLYANHIQHENAMNDNTRQNDVMDPLEGMALRHEDVQGGNGTAAATLQDLGYEQMNGTTGSGEPELKPKRKYARKTMKVAVPSAMDPDPNATAGGVSAGGVSAGGVSGGGVSGGTLNNFEAARELIKQLGGSAPEVVGSGVSGGKKRGRKMEGGDFGSTIRDIADTVGSVGKAVMPFAPLLLGLGEPKEAIDTKEEEGGAAKKKRSNARAEIVHQIMKEKGLKLTEASKYVKEHGLYKKGGALLSLASLDEMKPNQGPVMFQSGGVTNTKLPVDSEVGIPPVQAGSKPKRKTRAKKIAVVA